MRADSSYCAAGLARCLKKFSQWDGWLLVCGGAIVLAGWCLGNEPMKRILPGFVAMNPITALGFILAGTSLLCFWRKGKVFGRAPAALLMAIGLFKLCEYTLGWHSWFDQALFTNEIVHDRGVPNQIAPNTALNFLVGGIALWLLNSPRSRFSRWAQNLSIILLFISLAPLVGYVYGAAYLYSVGAYIPMALHTAVLFCLLAFGTLLAQTDAGVVAVFTSRTPGGTLARRLLPLAFGVPFTLGAVVILGERQSLYPAELGVSMVVVGAFAAFSALIWWNTSALNRADERRRKAELELQRAHDELEARVAERTASLRRVNEALQTQIMLQLKAQEKIREQATLLDEAKDAIVALDLERRVTFWNKGAERIYGRTEEEALGKSADDLLFAAGKPEDFHKVYETGAWMGELAQKTKSGQALTVESSWTLVKDDAGKPKCLLIINTNITEKKNYEAQLLRSQRMESLGTLAGGIAHDLNNALAPVIIGAELLKQNANEAKRGLLVETILASAQRGTEMVRQILSFARGSQGQAKSVQIGSLLKEMVKILRDTFPKSMGIECNLGRDLWAVRGDVTELHQVLLNLCVNARDAMPQGGRLTLAAENVKKEDVPAGNAPGPYVMLSVADTGTGIAPELLPRIFEPFFSTKGPEKGTGLGLSTVSNILKHHNGFIQVRSEVGKGTQFRVFLPALPATEPAEGRASKPNLPAGHGEMIMVMDDELAVRELAKTTLENFGYRVVTAPNGLLGITCFEEYKNEIQVVVSDTDMPFADGFTAIRSIQKAKPDIRIIIASGGKRESQQLQGIDMKHLTILDKPYTMEQLLTAVADGMGSGKILNV